MHTISQTKCAWVRKNREKKKKRERERERERERKKLWMLESKQIIHRTFKRETMTKSKRSSVSSIHVCCL